jgi:hypothetical protein
MFIVINSDGVQKLIPGRRRCQSKGISARRHAVGTKAARSRSTVDELQTVEERRQ